MGIILGNKPQKGQVKLKDFKQQLMKRIKKRVKKDQFLNSKYAR